MGFFGVSGCICGGGDIGVEGCVGRLRRDEEDPPCPTGLGLTTPAGEYAAEWACTGVGAKIVPVGVDRGHIGR